MAKKNIDHNSEKSHGLVLFDELSSTKESKDFEPEPLQYVDQADKIHMVYKLVPFGGNYLYSLLIIMLYEYNPFLFTSDALKTSKPFKRKA